MNNRQIKQLLQENIVFSPPQMSIDKKKSLSFNQKTSRKKSLFLPMLACCIFIIALILPATFHRVNSPNKKNVPEDTSMELDEKIMNLNIWDYFKNLKASTGTSEELVYDYLKEVDNNLVDLVNNFYDYQKIFSLVDASNDVTININVNYHNKDYIVSVDKSYRSLVLKEDSLEMHFIIDDDSCAFVINSESEKVIIFRSMDIISSLIVKDDNYKYMEYAINQSSLYINTPDKESYLLSYEEDKDTYQIIKDFIYLEEMQQKINELLEIK